MPDSFTQTLPPSPAGWSAYSRPLLALRGPVHINSGIPNKAFHTLAVELGGYAWERAGAIWYETLRHYRLQPDATFRSFAR